MENNIYRKIQVVKRKLLEANLKKTGINKFSNYTYYELADFLPTLIKLCDEEGLFTGVRFDDEFAYLDIVNIEKPEEKVTYTSPMRALELKGANAVQALGGVETYSRRYLYMAAFDIVENDMFDSTTTEQQPKKELVTKEQANTIYALLVEAGANDEGIKKTFEAYKVKEAEELTTIQYAELLKALKQKIENNKKIEKPAESKKVAKTITEAQVKRLYTIASGNNELAKSVLAEYGFTSSKDITTDKYEEICGKIEKKVGEANGKSNNPA